MCLCVCESMCKSVRACACSQCRRRGAVRVIYESITRRRTAADACCARRGRRSGGGPGWLPSRLYYNRDAFTIRPYRDHNDAYED